MRSNYTTKDVSVRAFHVDYNCIEFACDSEKIQAYNRTPLIVIEIWEMWRGELHSIAAYP